MIVRVVWRNLDVAKMGDFGGFWWGCFPIVSPFDERRR